QAQVGGAGVGVGRGGVAAGQERGRAGDGEAHGVLVAVGDADRRAAAEAEDAVVAGGVDGAVGRVDTQAVQVPGPRIGHGRVLIRGGSGAGRQQQPRGGQEVRGAPGAAPYADGSHGGVQAGGERRWARRV